MGRGTGRAHALVVDGDPDGRAVVAGHLAEHGFEVTEAPDGRSALTAVEQAPPTLVVVDVELADMDGFEILRLLRRATDAPLIVVRPSSCSATNTAVSSVRETSRKPSSNSLSVALLASSTLPAPSAARATSGAC